MKKFNIFLILVTVVIVVVAALPFRFGGKREAQPIENLPWQVETLPDGGSRVFGLVLGQSTIGDAQQRFGTDMEIGVIAEKGERPGALEAYYGDFTAGMLTGKMVLVAGVDKQVVQGMRDRAVKSEYMESTTRKYTLNGDDLALALKAPIATITFIPSANLDEQIVLDRFGAPSERLRTDENIEHFLYPAKGLDLALDSKGKDVLQYVAPRDFARLRDPVVRAAKKGGP